MEGSNNEQYAEEESIKGNKEDNGNQASPGAASSKTPRIIERTPLWASVHSLDIGLRLEKAAAISKLVILMLAWYKDS